MNWFADFKDRLQKAKRVSVEDIRGYSQLLGRLQQELQHMKEDFSSRVIELPRSHTPTIGELHSDSGSTQSVSTHRSGRHADSRRLSSSAALAKLRGQAKPAPPAGLAAAGAPDGGHNLHDSTILEDTEDETTQMITGKVSKSPSLPCGRLGAAKLRTRSITGLGMFRSIRRRSVLEPGVGPAEPDPEEARALELRDLHHRRTRSWNKRPTSYGAEEAVLISPLTMPESQIKYAAGLPQTSEQSVGSSDRQRGRPPPDPSSQPAVVSFSTPKYGKSPQSSETDSSEFCITAKHHLI